MVARLFGIDDPEERCRPPWKGFSGHERLGTI